MKQSWNNINSTYCIWNNIIIQVITISVCYIRLFLCSKFQDFIIEITSKVETQQISRVYFTSLYHKEAMYKIELFFSYIIFNSKYKFYLLGSRHIYRPHFICRYSEFVAVEKQTRNVKGGFFFFILENENKLCCIRKIVYKNSHVIICKRKMCRNKCISFLLIHFLENGIVWWKLTHHLIIL